MAKYFTYTPTMCWVVIKLYNINPNDAIDQYVYKDMTPDHRLKWDWFFRYRAALLQVQNPKLRVEMRWGAEQATGKTLEQLKAKKVITMKGKITKHKNTLADFIQEFEKYKASYTQLFPIQDQLEYKRYINSIELAKSKIALLEQELLTLNQ